MDWSGGALAPFYDSDSDAAIPDDFAVLFRPGHTLKQHFEFINKDMSSVANFESFGWGYAANLSNSDHLDGVRRDSGVLGVERTVRGLLIDSVASSNASLEPEMNEVTANTIVKRGYKTDVNEGAPYGLQMLGSGRKLSTPVREIGRYDYLHGAGAGVNVYILDTGIRIGLPQFGGRARHFGGLRSTDKSPYCDDTMDDVVGHGTQ